MNLAKLVLVGEPHPCDVKAMRRVPDDYVALMAELGPGMLGGRLELVDPLSERFTLLNARFRARAPDERLAGRWQQLSDDDVMNGTIIGVANSGDALHVGRYVSWLQVKGRVLPYATLVEALRDWNDVPQIYVTEPSRRPTFYAALETGDEAAADRALVRVLEVEHPVDGNLAIACYLATHDLPLRGQYIGQCLRAAKRHAALAGVDVRALSSGPVTPELLAPLEALATMHGVFAGAGDQTEVALLEQLAEHPDDAGARLVLADHLEEAGDLTAATAFRATTSVAPLDDLAERGFIAPAWLEPIDGAARLQLSIDRWRKDAPQIDITALVTAVAALHPQERQGYAMRLAIHRSRGGSIEPLVKEISKAWPYLVLSLRGEDSPDAVRVLVETASRDAMPYIWSTLVSPSPEPHSDYKYRLREYAEMFIASAKPTSEQLDKLVEWLEQPSAPNFAVAARLLVKSAANDRVFEAYLANFVEADPFSIQALAKRRKQPRVVEVLSGQFAQMQDELKARRFLTYPQGYGKLALYLKRLEVPGAAEAHALYSKNRPRH